jgi:hypothetical protein
MVIKMFAQIREKLRGYKTIIANAVVGLPAGALFVYTQFSTVDVTPVLPAKYVAAFIVGNAVLGIVLRLVTTGPIGSKGDEPATPTAKEGN